MKDQKKDTAAVSTDLDAAFAKKIRDANYRQMVEAEKAKLACAGVVLEARETAGLSQQDLADKSGVPKSTIVRIENGNNVSIETLAKLASAMGKRLIISFE